MTLSEVLKKFGNKNCVIEYRSIINNTDAFCGMARYINKMLVSCDGDTYHLSDEVIKYEWFKDDWLVIWV